MPKYITTQTILAAKAGNDEALNTIAQHYAPYIATLSKRPFYDEYGNRYYLVDNEIRHHIESRLLLQIVYKFDPDKLPGGEKLTAD